TPSSCALIADLQGVLRRASPAQDDSNLPLRHPPRNKQIRVMSLGVRAVRAPHEPLSIRAENREAVERGRGRDALRLTVPVLVHDEDVELAASRVEYVRREDDVLLIRREERAEICRAVLRDLARVRP